MSDELKKEEYKDAYVFAPGPDGRPVLAGSAHLTPRGGEFTYAKTWYESPWGYSLDPINLPLTLRTYLTTSKKGVYGVLLDAAPDSWGERIMLLKNNATPKNEIERLLRLSGAGVGGVQFSLARTTPKVPDPLPSIKVLDTLASTIDHIDKRQMLSSTELLLIEPGSSMGGARPKVSLMDEEGRAWIAKFSRQDDVISYPEVEFASMGLMAKAGINVPRIQLRKINSSRYCYLIERFDRHPGEGIHFISANALFNVERLRIYQDSRQDPAGYIAFARILRKISAKPKEDCVELFKRMVYSIIIGGTDDHARNHAMIFNVAKSEWRLSPAYDVLPIVSSQGQQSMGVGLYGRESSIRNALSGLPDFGVARDEGAAIVADLLSVINGWDQHFVDGGVSAGDMQILRNIINKNISSALTELDSM